MKAAFFHDTKLSKDKEGTYYSPSFSYEIWQRYLNVFDELTICTRQSNEILNDYSKFRVSSGENVRFKLNEKYKNPIQFFINRKNIKQVITEVVDEVDCCIVRLPSVIGILAVQECIKRSKPWAVEVVACCWDSLWNYGSIKGKILAPIMYLLNRYYIKKSSHAIYVSKEFLQERYPCNGIVSVASNVNIEIVDDSVLYKRIERINDTTKNDVILGIIGSLDVEFKGHRTAIYAVKDLKEKGYNVNLKCLGQGNKDKWISLAKKLGVESQIEFCGILPSGEPVFEWIDNIDIFIMPSLQEGLPRSMVEAMSRACPVIGARTGGIPELLDDDFIIEKKDFKKLSYIISEFIENKDICTSQAQRNFIKSKNYYKEKIDKNRFEFWNTFKTYSQINKR